MARPLDGDRLSPWEARRLEGERMVFGPSPHIPEEYWDWLRFGDWLAQSDYDPERYQNISEKDYRQQLRDQYRAYVEQRQEEARRAPAPWRQPPPTPPGPPSSPTPPGPPSPPTPPGPPQAQTPWSQKKPRDIWAGW